MIVRLVCFLSVLMVFSSCEDTDRDIDISDVEKSAEFRRFDQAFFETDTNRLAEEINLLEEDFPEFFIGGKNMVFWNAQRTDEQQLQLYQIAQEVFDDPEALNENLDFSMKHFYYYYPEEPEVTFYAYISNLDFEFPVLYADSVCFAALDLYLGPGRPFYSSLPEYIAFYRQPSFLVRDCMEAVIAPKIKGEPVDGSLLDAMIYYGKKLYFLEQMMPQKDDKIIIQYTPEELQFCNENERTMWSYFIENNYLFDTSHNLKRRFTELAPFSKFRLKNDNETPGMVGRWVGWQIVRAFMDNNPDLSLPELAEMSDARKILKLSGYKP